ncbi:hypothetical protein U1Q18_017638, partial [Sarracenia purpurea var. burkii]
EPQKKKDKDLVLTVTTPNPSKNPKNLRHGFTRTIKEIGREFLYKNSQISEAEIQIFIVSSIKIRKLSNERYSGAFLNFHKVDRLESL